MIVIASGRPRAKKLLPKSKRLNLIFNSADWLIVDVDVDAALLFDCTVEQMVGQDIRHFLPICESEVIANPSTDVDYSRWSSEVFTEGRKSDGKTFNLSCAVKRFNFNKTDLIMLEVHAHAEGSLGDTVARYFHQMISTSNEIFWITDAKGAVPIYVSPAYENIFGRSVKSLMENPKEFFSFPHPQDRDRLVALIRETRATDKPCETEYRIFDGNGRPRWLWVRLNALKDEDGSTIGICGVTVDITDKKSAEVRIGEFHSTLSHELRTPLTSIKASLMLINRAKAENKWERFDKLQAIALEETERLIRLVSDLLDIKKIADGQFKLVKSNFSAQSIVDKATQSAKPYAEQHHVALKSEAEDIQLIADHDKLLQVLINLLSNAIKFSPENSAVELSATKRKSHIRFSVNDSGPGISSEDAPKLFKRFQQLDQSDSRPKGGTGLGLAISKAIVEEHDGAIGIAKGQLGGAEFWFELPLV